MSGELGTILLVEDERNDVFLLQHAFDAAAITNPIQVMEDGQQAIEYLAGIGKYADRAQYPMPCLLFLDLKLPIKSGLDVLGWIQKQPKLRRLLVVVLSSSRDRNDVDAAYQLGARSYLVKPLTMDARLELAKAIKQYWLQLNVLPGLDGLEAGE
jgi:CheY-like chemotaxis protein